MEMERFKYDNGIVKLFVMATVIFGVVGMLVGLTVASQFIWPDAKWLGSGISWMSFGRLRPLHTNAVIFAFVGNAFFAGAYYSTQRLVKARMFSDVLSRIHFWGWQLIIAAAAISLPLGFTTSKEYAELEWPIDIAITLIWVVFAINFVGTLIKRRERHLYVAIWFYIASIVTVAVLHIVNSFALPYGWMHSYSAFAGVQDALVQWWYGHNAVAFFLTTPFLGLMYYFMPKAANRPVYSYKLSIIHFWALIFLYIWAGPHHLLYSSLPNWAQVLGTVFSIMLLAPSWGGMLNGLLTLRGAWDRVREDPILKFMVVAVTAYGMSTFEGPMLSLKNVNAISHFTDWTIAHVHVGGLGWNGFLIFGMIYWMIPRMWNTKLHSVSLANTHFWLGTLGILFYVLPMYISGMFQSMMWKQFNEFGNLAYPNFLEILSQFHFHYILRLTGGLLYFTGVCLMIWNLIKTASSGEFIANEEAEAMPLAASPHASEKDHWHRWIEGRPVKFLILALVAILIGGFVEYIPMVIAETNTPTIATVKPYTPLELAGRDIYIREGCTVCHSQMIRPFRSETERYGEYSKAGEYVYDHPFVWGSKRTGPDLMRVGGKYSDDWHYNHMQDPRATSPGSIMPIYPWIFENDLDLTYVESKITVLRKLGVPYPEGFEKEAVADLQKQADGVVSRLKAKGINDISRDKELIALIAYLQRLGKQIETSK